MINVSANTLAWGATNFAVYATDSLNDDGLLKFNANRFINPHPYRAYLNGVTVERGDFNAQMNSVRALNVTWQNP